MHTETEAHGLWCPWVRHEGDQAGSFNRGWNPANPLNQAPTAAEASYLCNCIGSSCAAWRWGHEKRGQATENRQRTGYCGMVGRGDRSPA